MGPKRALGQNNTRKLIRGNKYAGTNTRKQIRGNKYAETNTRKQIRGNKYVETNTRKQIISLHLKAGCCCSIEHPDFHDFPYFLILKFWEDCLTEQKLFRPIRINSPFGPMVLWGPGPQVFKKPFGVKNKVLFQNRCQNWVYGEFSDRIDPDRSK